MRKGFSERLLSLELEEKILSSAGVLGMISMFLPWLSGEWLGGENSNYSAFEFFTSFMGFAIFLMLLAILALTLLPGLGGIRVLPERVASIVRVILASQCVILIVCILTIFTNLTFEFSRMEIRFGLYLALVCSMVITLYSIILLQQERKEREHAHEPFRHPQDHRPHTEKHHGHSVHVPPPPPPPPSEPSAPEDHRLYP